jgi:hypothetical protein
MWFILKDYLAAKTKESWRNWVSAWAHSIVAEVLQEFPSINWHEAKKRAVAMLQKETNCSEFMARCLVTEHLLLAWQHCTPPRIQQQRQQTRQELSGSRVQRDREVRA